MEDGAEITVDSVQQFVHGFRNDKLPTSKIAAVHKTAKNDHVSTWILEAQLILYKWSDIVWRKEQLGSYVVIIQPQNKETPSSLLDPISVIPLLLS